MNLQGQGEAEEKKNTKEGETAGAIHLESELESTPFGTERQIEKQVVGSLR